MKKFLLILFLYINFIAVFAQNSNYIITDSKAISKGFSLDESSANNFSVNFSFDSVKIINIEKNNSSYAKLQIKSLLSYGVIGQASLPELRKFIAIPLNANCKVRVIEKSVTEIDLNSYGISQLFPQQPDVRKDQDPAKMPFEYDSKYYSQNIFHGSELSKIVEIGSLRGIRLGELIINPISYNPVENKLLVYNDLKIEIVFENADLTNTRKIYNSGINPYFENIYSRILNQRLFKDKSKDLFDDNPDFYNTPVRMLLIADDLFEQNLQPFIRWKSEKGFYLDVHYKSEIGTTTSAIQSFIINAYNQSATDGNPYTFLVLVGDIAQIPAINGVENDNLPSDLYYASVDGDFLPEMFHSRISVETTAELDNYIEKLLYYEKFEIADPSYLNDVLLVAGVDGYYNLHEAQPTLHYGENYYFNQSHGFQNVYAYYDAPYTGCYNRFNDGVGFANYTAHGGTNCWADPYFGTEDVYNLTNINKYFWAVGNCCQSGDFTSGLSLGESIIRAEKKGGFAYIGSVPNSYWGADFYWTVGYLVNGTIADQTTFTPTFSETDQGMYQYYFDDSQYNSVSSLMFTGNLTVLISEDNPTGKRYFEAYHTMGDGSVVPYRVAPTANNVSYSDTILVNVVDFNLSADANSYAAISKNGQLLGVGLADNNGDCTISFENPLSEEGEYLLVITAPQKIPVIDTLVAVYPNTEYIAKTDHYLDGDGILAFNETTNLSIKIKNISTIASSNLTLSLTCNDAMVTITNPSTQINALQAGEEILLQDLFELVVSPDIENGHNFVFNFTIQSQNNSWQYNIPYTAYKPILNYLDYDVVGDIIESQNFVIKVTVKNLGGVTAQNTIATLVCSDDDVTIVNSSFNIGNIAAYDSEFAYFVASISPINEPKIYDFYFHASSDDNYIITDSVFSMENANTCHLILTLLDTYGDGWCWYGNCASLTLSFSDSSPNQIIEFTEELSSKTIDIAVNKYTDITFTFSYNNASYCEENSFILSDELNNVLFNSGNSLEDGFTYTHANSCACEIPICSNNPELIIDSSYVENGNGIIDFTINDENSEYVISYFLYRGEVLIASLSGDCTNYQDILSDVVYDSTYTYSLVSVCSSLEYSDTANISISFPFVIQNVANYNDDSDNNIYPNPIDKNTLINIVNENNETIELTDINGRTIMKYDESKTFMSPSNSGIYFIKIGNKVYKLIVL